MGFRVTMFYINSVYIFEEDFDAMPCPCCGFDLFENHVCNHSPTRHEKELQEVASAKQKKPTFWHCLMD
jgi:hypothetical protein